MAQPGKGENSECPIWLKQWANQKNIYKHLGGHSPQDTTSRRNQAKYLEKEEKNWGQIHKKQKTKTKTKTKQNKSKQIKQKQKKKKKKRKEKTHIYKHFGCHLPQDTIRYKDTKSGQNRAEIWKKRKNWKGKDKNQKSSFTPLQTGTADYATAFIKGNMVL